MAFSDDGLRREIFGIIDRLDDEAAKKGEPLGLILTYTVELGMDGIRVGRYADEIPAGQIVNLTPTDRAMIFLKIKDNFPTQQFLGPLIVNRPALESVPGAGGFSTGQSSWPEPTGVVSSEGWQNDAFCRADGVVCSDNEINKLPSLAKEGWQPVSADGVVCSDNDINKPPSVSEPRAVATGDLSSDGCPAIPLGPSSLEPARVAIPLGPIRLLFEERFPCVSAAKSSSQPAALQAGNLAFQSKALKPPNHLPPWAALQVGNLVFQSTSGLSPPPAVGECGTLRFERCSSGIGNRR